MQTTANNIIDKRELRDAFGRFPTGVAIATALAADGRPVGMTINSLTSISLAPALLAWSIDREAASYDAFAQAERFAISVLAETQAHLALRFATRGADKFGALRLEQDRAPVIPNACAWFQCETWQSVPLGDHTMLVGKVVELDRTASKPLLFLGGQFQLTGANVYAMTPVAA